MHKVQLEKYVELSHGKTRCFKLINRWVFSVLYVWAHFNLPVFSMAVITRIFGFEGKTSDAILLHVNKECCRQTQSGLNLSDRNLKKKSIEQFWVCSEQVVCSRVLKKHFFKKPSTIVCFYVLRQNLTPSSKFPFLNIWFQQTGVGPYISRSVC